MTDRAWRPQSVPVYWDRVADRYLELYRDELGGKPFDRRALDAFAERVGRGGRACDVGCGPCGHVTRYLADRGLDTIGVDISPRCTTLARREQPSLTFEVMDMSSLVFFDATWTGLSRTTRSVGSGAPVVRLAVHVLYGAVIGASALRQGSSGES